MIPGEYFIKPGSIDCNVGKGTVSIGVTNMGDRPVQIGSHFHFFEVNRQLIFDREAAYGCRLDIPAGTAVRFEPGEEKEVKLVTLGGYRRSYGFNNLLNGDLDAPNAKSTAMMDLKDKNFKNIPR